MAPTPLVVVVVVLLLLPFPSTSFTPDVKYYIDCGSSSSTPTTFLNRSFVSDSTKLDLFLQSTSSSSTISNNTLSSSLNPIYTSARIFNSPFWYSFTVPPNSTLLLRLHFLPLSPSLLSSSLLLTVPFASLLLLRSFNTTSLTSPTIKEYLLFSPDINLNLTFQPSLPASTAYINAIELFTPPSNLTNSTTPILVSTTLDVPLSHQSMELVLRANAGGPAISPANDSLYRSWLTDTPYLYNVNASIPSTTNSTIAFASELLDGLSTIDVAPETVYDSLQEIKRGDRPDPMLNITWVVQIPAGYSYMVRLHFCDFVSASAADLVFNIYINNQTGFEDLKPSTVTGGRKLVPFFLDFVVEVKTDKAVMITVGSSDKSTGALRNAILNGFEIFKLNNSFSSFDGDENPFFPTQPNSSNHMVVIIATVAAFAVVILICIFGFIFFKRKRQSSAPKTKANGAMGTNNVPITNEPNSITMAGSTTSTESLLQATATTRSAGLRIPLLELNKATNCFDEKLVIGHGGFGKVYKGVLRDGTPVAVKRASATSRQGSREFQTEITVLSQIRHRHLVSLIGYCDEERNMMLMYEYMPRGPFKDLLHGPMATSPLSWKQRLEVCIGAARGLHYLHTGFTHRIIHRDVKSSNILLGDDYGAKVSDFGLSRIGPSMNETHVSTAVKGSFGYLDPEYFRTQKLTDKSDVYSFGVVLFEAMSGRAAVDPKLLRDEINLGEWAVRMVKEGKVEEIVDVRIRRAVNWTSVRKVADTAVKCLAETGAERPAIGDVLWNLEYALQMQVGEGREEGVAGDDEESVVLPEVMVRYASMSKAGESDIFSQLMNDEGR